jgi:2-C-methyl-D-erythritol 4-phosphate cytidylyltransferase
MQIEFTLLEREARYEQNKILVYTGQEQRVSLTITGSSIENCWERATTWLKETPQTYTCSVRQVFPTDRKNA